MKTETNFLTEKSKHIDEPLILKHGQSAFDKRDEEKDLCGHNQSGNICPEDFCNSRRNSLLY